MQVAEGVWVMMLKRDMARGALVGACSAVALALLIVSNSGAEAQTYLGEGGINCRVLVAEASSKGDFKNNRTVTAAYDWALGYVSGLNMFWKTVKGTDRLIHSESPEVGLYTLRYCASHPDKNVVNAANDYFSSLPK